MKKVILKISSGLLMIMLLLQLFTVQDIKFVQAVKVKIVTMNRTKTTMLMGEGSFTASIDTENCDMNLKKLKSKWSIKSGKDIVKLTKKTDFSAEISALQTGTAVVEAKNKIGAYRCKVTVIQGDNSEKEKVKEFIKEKSECGLSSNLNSDSYEWNSKSGKLEGLNFCYCNEKFISLKTFEELKNVNISGGTVEDIDFSGNKRLKKLVISDVKNMSKVDLSSNTKMTSLDLNWSEIKKIDIKQCAKLRRLSVLSTKLDSLNVSSNRELRTLIYESKGIKKINLSNNSKIETLNLSGTDIRNLKLNKLINLKKLYLVDTNLKQLDVRKNKKVNVIRCNDNKKLKSIKLGKNLRLRTLDCSRTKIKSVNVKKCKRIKKIVCDKRVRVVGGNKGCKIYR